MTILVIIFLALSLFGRFLVWSAASRTGSFLFFTLIGAFTGGVILWVTIAYVCEIFDLNLYSNTDEMDTVALVEIGSSLVMGLIYACGQVNTKEHQRHFRRMDRMDQQLEALGQQEREALKQDIAAIRNEVGPQATLEEQYEAARDEADAIFRFMQAEVDKGENWRKATYKRWKEADDHADDLWDQLDEKWDREME